MFWCKCKIAVNVFDPSFLLLSGSVTFPFCSTAVFLFVHAFYLSSHVSFTMYYLLNASKEHDKELFLCRVEFDRLTDLLRARTIEPDPPAPIVLREDKNEGIRIDGIGGSTSHQVAADKSPTVKVRKKP